MRRASTQRRQRGRGGRQGAPIVRSLSNLVLTHIWGLLQQRTRAWQIKIMDPRLLVQFFVEWIVLNHFLSYVHLEKHVYCGLTCGLENRICNKLDFYESFTDIKRVGSGGGRWLVWATHATKYQWEKVAKYTNETRCRHLYSIQKKVNHILYTDLQSN
jgi:hypothetical protein